MEYHEAANSFPMMDNKSFAELMADIKEYGQREPITTCDGMILDGRNRHKACVSLGIEPKTVEYTGNPWTFVWSLNGERRNLVKEQRYLIWKHCTENSEQWISVRQAIQDEANRKRSEAAKERERTEEGTFQPQVRHSVAPMENEHKPVVGQSVLPVDKKQEPGKTAKATASKTNAGAVARGDKLAEQRPDLATKVRMGEVKPAEAHRQMKKDEYNQRVERAAKSIKQQSNLLPNLILCDPPWRYNFAETESRKIENQYDTLSVKEISECLKDTEPNCILLLWATAPKIREAFELIDIWGFEYKSQAIWDKEMIGSGYWWRGQHEILIAATKGKVSPPIPEFRVSSVFKEKRTLHSKKPECVYKWIEKAFADKIKLEMFCREPRESWISWGNEC